MQVFDSFYMLAHFIIRNLEQNPDSEMDEIDRQLQILMNNLKTPTKDFSTTCFKCCGVVGLNQGCTSMGKDYHISCLTCITCHKNLHNTEFRTTFSSEVFCGSCYDKVQYLRYYCHIFVNRGAFMWTF